MFIASIITSIEAFSSTAIIVEGTIVGTNVGNVILGVASLAQAGYWGSQLAKSAELQQLAQNRAVQAQSQNNINNLRSDKLEDPNRGTGNAGNDDPNGSSWWGCMVCPLYAAEIPKGTAGGPDAGKRFPEATKDAVRTGVCNICGDRTTRTPGPDSSEIDHIIPRCQGGNCSVQNAQETCRTCNRDKGSLTMEQHMDRLQREAQEIDRMRSLPPGERAGALREIFRKRWQALLRWGSRFGEEP